MAKRISIVFIKELLLFGQEKLKARDEVLSESELNSASSELSEVRHTYIT